MNDRDARGVVQSLPDRPLAEDEVVELVKNDPFECLVYSEIHTVSEGPGLITMAVDASPPVLLGFNHRREKWEVVWRVGDDRDRNDVLEEWSQDLYEESWPLIFGLDRREVRFL